VTGLEGQEPDNLLPGDWKRVTYIREHQEPQRPGAMPTWYEQTTVRVESARYNVVLEGSFPWIMQKITAYMLSSKQG